MSASPSVPQRRIVVLCDNESGHPACGCEWGLSLAVDLGGAGGLWLWDTGQTGLFLQNAAALGVDVGAARGLALSHGHYDHTGGLAELCGRTAFAGAIYAHPACAHARYAAEPNGKPRKSVGPPAPLPQFTPAGPVTRLAPGLTLLTDIARAPGRFESVAGFSLDAGGVEPDAVPDDAFLVLETAQGPVAVLGCCHSGLMNSLSCARERLGIASFHAVLGGLHLFAAGQEALAETAAAIVAFDIRQLVAGHCTGADRRTALAALLHGCDVLPLASGQTWIY
jgi:Metal-dependent hydrolases of the beta-lactamase superfamily II